VASVTDGSVRGIVGPGERSDTHRFEQPKEPPTVTTDAGAESAYSWLRLAICVLLSTVGGISLWSVVVVLPAVQAEFGVDRATASLPYTLTMIGFGCGRRGDGAPGRPLGHHAARADRRRRAQPGLHRRRQCDQPVAVRTGARTADRAARRIGFFRADRRRYLALVHPTARHRGGDRGIRQLSRRRDLAAAGAALRADHRLAADTSRHRRGVRW